MISSARSSFIAAFAEELRRAREYNNVTLEDVAAVTRISVESLDAIEKGRWEAIPQPYLRGYLHLYAQAVGMNVDKVLQSYDRIVQTPDDGDAATLDTSSPLLRQPEHIGVTRAKIRAGWFTELTQNRRTAYLALVAVIAILGTGLYLSRRAQRQHLSLTSFEQTVNEYNQILRGPISSLALFETDSTGKVGRRDTNRMMLLASDSGSAVIQSRHSSPHLVRYHPYDTLVILYDALDYVKLSPPGTATLDAIGGDSITPASVAADTVLYSWAAEKSDPAGVASDSLRRP